MSSSKGRETINVVDQINDVPWEVPLRKSKNQGGKTTFQKPWTKQNTAPRGNVGSGNGNLRPQSSTSQAIPTNPVAPPQPAIAAPLKDGWNWKGRGGAASQGGSGRNQIHQHVDPPSNEDDDIDNDDDSYAVDSDDELLDEFDSDESVQSFESRKKNKWFKDFFSGLNNLTVDEISEPAREWHCPACQNGPGSIDWYRGLQPLMNHARTKGSKRMKLHRELAELLDEELRSKGTSVIPAREAFGRWDGLKENVKHRQIIWPPMVVIMNTKLERDENDKWIGMNNEELHDYFRAYAAVKARSSYGPHGHRGMSMLIFEGSVVGYFEAECLNEHFKEQKVDREAWDRHPVVFSAGGKRQLYGYMAEKQDLDSFNKHSQEKSRLKYEMKSYHKMVVSAVKQMSEDNQLLIWYKDSSAKDKKHAKAVEESFELVSGMYRRASEEKCIVRQRSKVHLEQYKQEMDFQENYFKNQLKNIHAARDAKEDSFEKLQHEEREKVKESNAARDDGVVDFIRYQDKEMEEFGSERDELMKIHKEERAAVQQRYYDQVVELENKFDAKLNQLRSKFTPHISHIKVRMDLRDG